MGLLTGLLTLPLAPVRGVAWLADRILDQAEEQMYSPAAIRRQLDEIERAREEGRLSDGEATTLNDELLSRLIMRPPEGRGR